MSARFGTHATDDTQALTEAADVIKRLLDKLDAMMTPFIGTTPNDERVEIRQWLDLVCFSEDHGLYDDVMYILSRAGRLE